MDQARAETDDCDAWTDAKAMNEAYDAIDAIDALIRKRLLKRK